MYLETTQKHFYYAFRTSKLDLKWGLVNSKLNFHCADSHFLSFANPTRKKSKVILRCKAKPGELHNHEELSQEMLELTVIRWLCVLRIFSHRSKNTNFQLVQFVVSSWPHQLSLPLPVIESKISRFLNFYRNKAKDKKYIQQFLDQFGEDKFAHFQQVVLQFRSAPVPQGQFFPLVFLKY